jgi:hypothetical protein
LDGAVVVLEGAVVDVAGVVVEDEGADEAEADALPEPDPPALPPAA